jgi:hypothetical protein
MVKNMIYLDTAPHNDAASLPIHDIPDGSYREDDLASAYGRRTTGSTC